MTGIPESTRLRTLLWLSVRHHLSSFRWLPQVANDNDWSPLGVA